VLSQLRPLRPTLALWILSFLARASLGCTNEAHGEEALTLREFPGASTKAEPSDDSPPSVASSAEAKPPAEPEVPSLLLSAVGDCTLGDPAGSELAPGSFHRAFADGDYERPFSGVSTVLGRDDLTIANLEGTLTTDTVRRDLPFSFRGKPEFAKMLSLGSVDVVSMANNHANDCGPKGIAETKKSLESVNVGYFGLGTIDTRTVKGIEVKNLGYLGGRLEVKDEMMRAVTSSKRPDNLVIVSFHWGIEGSHEVTDIQQKLGHAAIDAGADLVLGHHPHVLQGIETYKDKKIVYSLGNFVFGGNAQPDDLASMIYQARFTKKDGVVAFVGDEVIPVHFSGNAVQNDFVPILLEGPAKARVLDDMKAWAKLVPGQ
jgi:poly-gamma-glutamate synthesis protein (capsule biosynthesis protein)